MNTVNERCKRLRILHDRITKEIQELKNTISEKESETFENPIATINIIKSLQTVLQNIEIELAKCPPEI